MHILDWVIYIVSVFLTWNFILPKDLKYEIGALMGMFIMICYSIVYAVVFYFFNWIDIFHWIGNFSTTISL